MMKNKAFTLIETLIGITLITVVLTAVTGLILSTMLSNQRNTHSLQANAFAQEGIEAMRYIRDSNWLQNYSWDGGSTIWSGDFNVSGDDSVEFYLEEKKCPPCWGFSVIANDGLVENGKGFDFVRKVKITPVMGEEALTALPDTAEVTVSVGWTDRGIDREVQISTYLTDWK